ncbi:Carbohydrate deacetylase [Echinococcus granulosus]|nr:Carbohydrate deacetylase [Echinococcus granulosus]
METLVRSNANQTSQLAIVADDGFYADRRDVALVECWKHGAVTDVSVLMNGGVVRSSTTPATSVLLNYCMQEAALPGLHINLSEGEPLSTKGSISSLLEDGTGLFYGKANLRRNLQTVHLWHVEIEIERQIIKFEKLFGVSPLRVDGHQHCHVLPGIVEVLCRLLPRHSVSWIRLPEEVVLKQRDSQMLFSRMNLAGESPIDFYREVSSQAAAARVHFQSAGLKSTDAFIGMLTMGQNMTIDNLQACFSVIDRPATVELMTHPGYPLSGSDWATQGCSARIGPDEFSRSTDRSHEMTLLRSQEFRNLLKHNNIRLNTFSTF